MGNGNLNPTVEYLILINSLLVIVDDNSIFVVRANTLILNLL